MFIKEAPSNAGSTIHIACTPLHACNAKKMQTDKKKACCVRNRSLFKITAQMHALGTVTEKAGVHC